VTAIEEAAETIHTLLRMAPGADDGHRTPHGR
jgi:hypothetical protein